MRARVCFPWPWNRLMFSGLLLFCYILGSCLPAMALDPKDWFILTPGSQWHYTGEGQSNSSTDDDFTYKVLNEKIDINGVFASRLQILADEPTDARHMDEDFWYVDPEDSEGKLFFYGIHNATADHMGNGYSLPAQDIILTDPLLIVKGYHF